MIFVDTQNGTRYYLAGPCDLRVKGHHKLKGGGELPISGVYAIEFVNHAAESVAGFNRILVSRGLQRSSFFRPG